MPKPTTRKVPASRRARAEELRRRRERRSLRNRLIAVAALLALAGAAFYVAARDDPVTIESAVCQQDSEHDPEREPIHVPAPTFEVTPPAGGQHTPDAARPGIYREGDEIPTDGQLVHAMEHGYVVLWHRPPLAMSKEDMTAIERLSDKHGRELIVVPRRSLGGPVAVTAWHRRLLCSAMDSEAISAFVTAYRDKGPEKGFL